MEVSYISNSTNSGKITFKLFVWFTNQTKYDILSELLFLETLLGGLYSKYSDETFQPLHYVTY